MVSLLLTTCQQRSMSPRSLSGQDSGMGGRLWNAATAKRICAASMPDQGACMQEGHRRVTYLPIYKASYAREQLMIGSCLDNQPTWRQSSSQTTML